MKTTVVTTTIFVPTFLTAYSESAQRHGHKVDFIVIGDRKTPFGTAEFCATIPNCTYLDLAAQDKYMRRFLSLANHLPIDSVERRNIGMLLAYERGADVIITLDDDNFSTSHDFIGSHGIVGSHPMLPTWGSSTGWLNVCSFLQEKNNVEFHHRGYPPKQRWANGFVTQQTGFRRVIVNAGFWLDNPDVDAITRLERELVVTGYKPDWRGTIALAPGTWSPFNCQNTALLREVIPAYFMSPYAGRHADIFASYVVNRLAQHFGDVIAFGDPLAHHKRSPHDLWKDLDAERKAMQLTDEFCDRLRNTRLTADTYHKGFDQIVESLYGWAEADAQRLMIVKGMLFWHMAFDELVTE